MEEIALRGSRGAAKGSTVGIAEIYGLLQTIIF